MKRRATQLLLGLGLLLVLVSVAALLRGVWVSDVILISWVRPPRDGVQVLHDVDVLVNRQISAVIWSRSHRRVAAMATGPWRPRLTMEHSTPGPPGPILRSAGGSIWDRLGFMGVWRRSISPFALTERGAAVPTWFFALLGVIIALPPARALRRARLLRLRRARGLCPSCGYDLRGAEHERCPECGASVEAARV